MRTPSEQSVPLWSYRATVLWCGVFLLWACPPAPAVIYDAGTPITDVSITNPTANEVWLAGSDHTLTCTTATDTDRECDESGWHDVDDSVTHYWTGTGTFKNNNNIGTSVTYICTDTAGNNTVTVYADDNYAPANNDAIVDESPTSDSETVSVVVPTLEWVTFGGTNKYTLYKKDANPWNVANENYATAYGTAVPNKAWVRSPALMDPVCYQKNSTGAQVTASINFSTPPGLTEASTVSISGNDGVPNVFVASGVSASGAATTVPAMNYADHFLNLVGGALWSITWSYRVPTGSNNWIGVGTSADPLYLTWGVPGGSTVTAKRMDWAAFLKCQDVDNLTLLAERIRDGVNADTIFNGSIHPANHWQALDRTTSNDCLAASELAALGIRLLGVPAGDVSTQVSWASRDATGNPNYPSDVSTSDSVTGFTLYYCSDGGAGAWYLYEGNFRVKVDGTWKYWTVFDPSGPFIGTGTTDVEKHKSGLYKVLDYIRDGAGTNFLQKWNKVGANIPLP